jgi:hypothetical protein
VLFAAAARYGRPRLTGAVLGWYALVVLLHALWDASRGIAVWLTLQLTATPVRLLGTGGMPMITMPAAGGALPSPATSFRASNPAGVSMMVEDLLTSDLIRHRHSSFPLTEGSGGPIGLVTFNQVRRVPPQERPTTRLRDIACPLEQVAQARPDEPAADLLPRLNECAEGRALIWRPACQVGRVKRCPRPSPWTPLR